jgi:RNA polymerase sigma-70 factor (ECF subfamily)
MERPSNTHVSLLVQLRLDPANQSAWRDFVSRYGRQIYGWCRQWGVQDADAEDVTQSVLLILTERLRDFQYDPQGSFRAWLKTVTYHAWSKNREARQRSGQGSGDSIVAQRLDSLEARDDLAARLEAEFDRELLERAMLQVAQRVASNTWHAFHLTAVDGISGAEAARRLNLPVASVYVAKSRVQRLIQKEIALLESGLLQGV